MGDLHGAPNTHKRQRGRDERPAKSLTAERKKRRQGPRRAQRLAAGKNQRENREENRKPNKNIPDAPGKPSD